MNIEERFDDQVRLLRERINDAFSSFQKDLYKDDSDVVAIGLVHDSKCASFNRTDIFTDIACSCEPRKVSFVMNNDGLLVEKGD